jgi:hypothetical protein
MSPSPPLPQILHLAPLPPAAPVPWARAVAGRILLAAATTTSVVVVVLGERDVGHVRVVGEGVAGE